MKKFHNPILFVAVVLSLTACSNTNDNQAPIETHVDTISTQGSNVEETPVKIAQGDYCFKKVENKDITDVKFRVLSDDDIRGEMIWQPHEKDGAVGTLTGKMISPNEIKFIYDYTIEGSRQAEEKIMKVEGQKLFIKQGELFDPKNDGHLFYKDVSKATYSEEIDAVKCE